MYYYKTKDAFMEYVDGCRFMIKNTFFGANDLDSLNISSNDKNIDLIVRNHRLKMIDIKLNHTMRMVEQIIKVNYKLGFRADLELLIKVAVLYHDIGRMRQSTWSNTFGDSVYKRLNRPFNNHGEEGRNIFLNNDFKVVDRYVPVISEVILHHQDHYMTPRLNYKYDGNLDKINIDDIITGNYQLNDGEWKIVSLIVQLVADIDKVDILYQHLTEDFDMVRDYVFDNSMDSLDDISIYWGVSKQEIIEYNKIDEVNYKPRKIRIPIKHMSIDKLEVPKYMKEMFYNDSWPELSVLVQDKNWNFICILWWRLSHFLNQISFSSTLINIEESKLLERMYELIPDRLRPLVYEAFEYSKDVFVSGVIEKNKGKIYIR